MPTNEAVLRARPDQQPSLAFRAVGVGDADEKLTPGHGRCHHGFSLARIMHETPSRDRGDGRATGQPQGLGPEAYFFSTSQGASPEDPRLPAVQNGAVPEAGSSAKQSASGATTFSSM